MCAIVSATNGPMIPGMVANVLVIPISTPAYCGAISIALTLYPDSHNPRNPTENVRINTETISFDSKYPTAINPVPAITKAVSWRGGGGSRYQCIVNCAHIHALFITCARE